MIDIFFDLDGTLIDSSDRMYHLFRDLIPNMKMSKEEYWSYKRDKINHQKLIAIKYPNIDYEKFEKYWMKQIETEKYLNYDYKYDDTDELLQHFKGQQRIVLLTARQSFDNLIMELRSLGMDQYFDTILVTEGKKNKSDLMMNYFEDNQFCVNTAFYVSDMGSDIKMANSVGVTTIAITHGFMNRQHLETYHPDFLVDNLWDIVKIIDD